jgi:tetratricopeptide (TPR) repeat protein
MKLIYYIFIFVFFCKLNTKAQSNRSVDSLLKSGVHDTIICKTLDEWIEKEPVESVWIIYNEVLHAKCKEKLMKYDNESERKWYKILLAKSYNNFGFAFQRMGKAKLAEKNYLEAIKLQGEMKDIAGLAASTNNYAQLMLDIGKIEVSIKKYTEAVNYFQILKDSSGEALALTNLGYVHQTQGNYLNAEELYKKSYSIRLKINDKSGLSGVLTNLAALYQVSGKRTLGEEYMKKAIAIQQELNDKYGLAYSYNNLAYMYKFPSEASKMIESLQKAATIQNEINDLKGRSITLNNMGYLYFLMNDYNKSLQFAEESYAIGLQLKSPALQMTPAKTMCSVYEKKNNPDKALYYFEQYIKMRDSINNDETRKASIELQLQYEFDKKIATDSIKNAEAQKIQDTMLAAQKLSLRKQKLIRYTLMLGLICTIIFVYFFYKRFKQTKDQSVLIDLQKEELSHAYYQLKERNKDILDSIHYARRIQAAQLPSLSYIERNIKQLKDT